MAGCCCCCCSEHFSLCEEMVKAYKYTSEILSVTHTDEDPADRTRKLSKMDIHRLEEQYNGIKQKLQTHIVVFKSDDNELVLKEPGVNTIQVNKRTRKHEAFTDQIPAKEVTLELSDKNYPQDRNGTWHAHLNLHCIMHLYDQPASETNPSEHDGDINKNVLFERLLCSEHQPINVPEPNTVIMEMNGDHQSIRSLHRKSSLKNPIPSSWNQPPFPNCKSASTEKLLYYPFPQKKNPRISEAARKLGLYVTH